jgi:hypothetical protein
LDYIVVGCSTQEKISEKVRELLLEGWELLGPCQVATCYDPDDCGEMETYAQTMVKIDREAFEDEDDD